MSTNGAWGFRFHGEDKIKYCHCDSYPEGLGQDIINEFNEFDGDIKEAVEKLRVIDGKIPATNEEIENLKQFARTEVSSGKLSEWYVLLRETQNSLSKTLSAGVIVDYKYALIHSHFCEWAYIVNLDDMLFEVYQGSQYESHQKSRYCTLPTDFGSHDFPIALIASYPLNALPENLAEKLSNLISDKATN